jgi:hypothetical protein
MAMEAFASSRRDDLQLAVFSLGPDEGVPNDPRIFAQMKTGGYSPDDAFTRTLAVADVFWLPFREYGMLTSGIPSNALEARRPSLASSWFYLEEYLGRSAIPCGNSKIAFTHALDTLDLDRVREATEVANRIRDQLWWEHIAPRTVFAYEIAESMRVVSLQRDRLAAHSANTGAPRGFARTLRANIWPNWRLGRKAVAKSNPSDVTSASKDTFRRASRPWSRIDAAKSSIDSPSQENTVRKFHRRHGRCPFSHR